MKSQNVRFEGTIPPDHEFEHPTGASLARVLMSELKKAGWQTADFDNWRDCGWIVPCARDDAQLDVVFSEWDTAWLLQVAATDCPGLVGSLFGRKVSATLDDIMKLSRDIHAILLAQPKLSIKGWRIDGPPDEKNSTPEPIEK